MTTLQLFISIIYILHCYSIQELNIKQETKEKKTIVLSKQIKIKLFLLLFHHYFLLLK